MSLIEIALTDECAEGGTHEWESEGVRHVFCHKCGMGKVVQMIEIVTDEALLSACRLRARELGSVKIIRHLVYGFVPEGEVAITIPHSRRSEFLDRLAELKAPQ